MTDWYGAYEIFMELAEALPPGPQIPVWLIGLVLLQGSYWWYMFRD